MLGLYFMKAKLFFKKNKLKVAAWLVLLMFSAAIGLGVAAYQNHYQKYFYIDYEGNKGVADWCKETDVGLMCGKKDNRVIVQQYWKGD